MSRYDQLQSSLRHSREGLLNHRLYGQLTSLESLRVFMENHVFAVWDFMSLLKSLQRELTCVEVPWRPSANASACRLINEIVLVEESDLDPNGRPTSHFELYLSAMKQAGADVSQIGAFVSRAAERGWSQSSVREGTISQAARDFIGTTFEIIDSGDVCRIASAFTFGREQLLPGVFERIVAELNSGSAGKLDAFLYYLQRHIEVDGDEHGVMAQRLMEELCQDSAQRWQAAEEAALQSLQARIKMWDSLADEISLLSPQTVLPGLS